MAVNKEDASPKLITQIYVMNNVISGETVKSKKLCQVCIRGVMTMVDNASGVEGANGTNGRSAFS